MEIGRQTVYERWCINLNRVDPVNNSVSESESDENLLFFISYSRIFNLFVLNIYFFLKKKLGSSNELAGHFPVNHLNIIINDLSSWFFTKIFDRYYIDGWYFQFEDHWSIWSSEISLILSFSAKRYFWGFVIRSVDGHSRSFDDDGVSSGKIPKSYFYIVS